MPIHSTIYIIHFTDTYTYTYFSVCVYIYILPWASKYTCLPWDLRQARCIFGLAGFLDRAETLVVLWSPRLGSLVT